ncbi:uncharacterized protein LOC127242338 [Andrographis paniculata]|uniref:uncharacterized protein LOC127242338 n=1 Tax=Andrographis paniculata TaxID=175694 RepID=UPI0021E97F4C|nr:uncharacterized protein LOC127242338 [Andrographis paniculata]
MGNANSVRCWVACVLPCGALDLIRIVHLNGSIDELTASRRITAADVLNTNPNHVLTKPAAAAATPHGRRRRRILILSPDAELKRGSVYFLIPASSLPTGKADKILKKNSPEKYPVASRRRGRRVRSQSDAGLWLPKLDSISEDIFIT